MRRNGSRGEGPVLEHRKRPLAHASGSDPSPSIARTRDVPDSAHAAPIVRGLHAGSSTGEPTQCGCRPGLLGDDVSRQAHPDRPPQPSPIARPSGSHASPPVPAPAPRPPRARSRSSCPSPAPPPPDKAVSNLCPPAAIEAPAVPQAAARKVRRATIVILPTIPRRAIRRANPRRVGRLILAASRFKRRNASPAPDVSTAPDPVPGTPIGRVRSKTGTHAARKTRRTSQRHTRRTD